MGRLFEKIFKTIFGPSPADGDSHIKSFCKAEYGKDWYYAYVTYKQDGKFPSIMRVRV